MNNLKTQFQGFLNTASLFDNYEGLKQFEVEKNKIENINFKSYEYFLPARFDWVCDCSLNKIWKFFDEVIAEIDLILKHKKSTLVWMKNKKDNTTQSFFITWW